MSVTVVARVDDDEFWVKDDSEGAIVADFPDNNVPQLGDRITIDNGRVKFDDGRLEIDVSAWTLVSRPGTGGGAPNPPAFQFDRVGDVLANSDQYMYKLVAFSGKTTAYTDDDADEQWRGFT